MPERIKRIITNFFTIFSSKTRLLFIPANTPAIANGINVSDIFKLDNVITPTVQYKTVLKILSTIKTALRLALNSSLDWVTLPIYAASKAPIPKSPQSTPDRIPDYTKNNF